MLSRNFLNSNNELEVLDCFRTRANRQKLVTGAVIPGCGLRQGQW